MNDLKGSPVDLSCSYSVMSWWEGWANVLSCSLFF